MQQDTSAYTHESLTVVLELAPEARWVSLAGCGARGGVVTLSATDDVVRSIEDLQLRAGEGPTVEALRTGKPVVVREMVCDGRWPRFTALLAADTPITTAVCIPMGAPGRDANCVNLYAAGRGGFTDAAGMAPFQLQLPRLVLAGVWQHRRSQQLERTLMTNRRIGMALGMVMARQQMTEPQAVDHLDRISNHTHRTLADLADEICRTGALATGVPGHRG